MKWREQAKNQNTYKKYLLCIGIVVITLGISGCENNKGKTENIVFESPNYIESTKSIEADAQEKTEIESDAVFIDEYGMNSLIKHKLYINSDSIQVEFYFDETVSKSHVSAARSFAIKKFALYTVGKYSAPYDALIINRGWKDKLKTVYCKIFIEENLWIQDTYQLNQSEKNEVLVYENTAILRDYNSLNSHVKLEGYVKKAEVDLKSTSVLITKSELGYCTIVRVHVKKPPTAEYVETVKKHVEEQLSPILSVTEEGIANSLASHGIVLEIWNKDELAYSELYVNISHNKRWVKEDWMNYDFVKEVNSKE